MRSEETIQKKLTNYTASKPKMFQVTNAHYSKVLYTRRQQRVCGIEDSSSKNISGNLKTQTDLTAVFIDPFILISVWASRPIVVSSFFKSA